MNKKKILSFRMPRLAKALKPAEIFQKIGKFAWYKCNNCNATYKSPDYDFSCTKCKSDFVEELNEEQAKEAQQKKNSEAIELSRNAIPQPRLPSSPFDTGFPAGFLLGPGIEQSFVRGGNSRQHQIGSNQRRQNDRNIRSRVVQDQNGEFRQVVYHTNEREQMRLREIDQMILILLQGYNFRNRSEQQPASEEAINRLKEVEVSKEDYDNDNNGNPVPPNCAICVDEMNDRAVRLRCKHMFHKECLVSWIKIHHVCPVCRVPVD